MTISLSLRSIADLLYSKDCNAILDAYRPVYASTPVWELPPIDAGASAGYSPVDAFERIVAEHRAAHAGIVDPRPSLLTALARAAGEDGQVTPEHVARTLGPRGAEVWAAIQRTAAAHPAPPLSDVNVFHGLDPDVAGALVRASPAPSYVGRMRAFDQLTELIEAQFPGVLSGCSLNMTQHLVESTRALFEALFRSGIRLDWSTLAGKLYSTDPEFLAWLQAQEAQVHDLSLPAFTAPDLDFRQVSMLIAKEQLVRLFAAVLPNQDVDALLLLDEPELCEALRPAVEWALENGHTFLIHSEGGATLRTLHEVFPAFLKVSVVVEHTEQGMIEIERMKRAGLSIQCLVINMAQSWLKKLFESPGIGENVVYHVEAELAECAPGFEIEPKEAVIVGYGAVGMSTALALRRRGFTVYVYDSDPKAMERAAADGFCIGPYGQVPEDEARRAIFAHGHLLIAATGQTSVEPAEFEPLLPDGAVVAQGASGNHELGMDRLGQGSGGDNASGMAKLWLLEGSDALELDAGLPGSASSGVVGWGVDDGDWSWSEAEGYTTTFQGRRIRLGSGTDSFATHHRVMKFPRSRKEILVLKNGYVVNLRFGLPPEYAQLTLMVVYLALVQAKLEMLARRGGGVPADPIPLREDFQQLAFDLASKDLDRRGLSLTEPDFGTLPRWG